MSVLVVCCVDVSVLPARRCCVDVSAWTAFASVDVSRWSDGQATKIAGGPRAVRRAVEHLPRQVLKLHKNPRRSSPIAPKGKKAARLLAERRGGAKGRVVDSVNAEKRRLLQTAGTPDGR